VFSNVDLGYVTTPVVISGSNFGATQSNSVVAFNGVAAVPTSWSDSQIVAPVPDGAFTGPITVQVAGFTATGPKFDVFGVAQVTDSLGHQTNYLSAVRGGKIRIFSSDGTGCSTCTLRGASQMDYDSAGHELLFTDALSHTTNYTYDGTGNLLTQSRALDSSTTATTTYTYNGFGEVLTATDPLGNTTTNTYDASGNLLTTTSFSSTHLG
jgi:YD repeat-containing protein